MKAPLRGRIGVRAFALALALGLAGLWIPQQNASAAAGDYSGSAYSDIVHVQALNLPDALELTDVAVAPSTAEMNSAGVPGGGNSHARALNVDADLLSAPDPAIPLDLIVDAEDRAPQPPAGPIVEELLNIPADPLLNATLARATANAKWNTGGCVAPGTPISYAKSELADASVLTGLGDPIGASLLSLHNSEGDTVYSESQSELINVSGQTNKGVKSTTTTQITAIRLFEGTANQLTINVVAPPVVTATATGQPGGAKVEYSEPVLQVLDADDMVIGELNASDIDLTIDGAPAVTLRLGTLTSVTKSNGTEASGQAVLLEIIVLNPVPTLDPLLRLTVAGGEVSAKVPSGGVDCAGGGGDDGGGGGDCAIDNPLKELQLGSSTLVAAKGSTFTYTISVSNRGKCTLTNVKVVDTIDGPEGSKVIDTDPEADSIDGLTVTWDDIGPLAPNQVKVLVVTVEVPSDAETGDKYTSEAKVTATGGGKNYAKGVKVEGPTVGGAGSGACNLTQSKVGPSHEEVKPGQTFNVYISLLNSGGEPCTATVKLPIDDGLTFVACTHDCDHTADLITWVVTIPPGDGQTLTATLKVPADAADGTVYQHVVTISDPGAGTITRTGNGPTVSGSSILAPFPSAGGADVGGAELPRTGAYILRWVALALAMVAFGGILREHAKARSTA
jgi:uncharacterized repeat protein (TIGR01451 family)